MNTLISFATLVVLALLTLVLFAIFNKMNKRKDRREKSDRTVDAPNAFLIPLETAVRMIRTFREGRGKVLDEHVGHKDTRSGWYSLDTLKQYVCWVEEVAKKRNIPITGMRYYYSAYPKDEAEWFGNEAGYQTMVIFPTTFHDANQRAFDPLLSDYEKPFFIEDELKRDKARQLGIEEKPGDTEIVYYKKGDNTSSSGLNRSQTCPPHGDCPS